MNFRVKAGSSDCAPTAKPAKCTVANGGTFSLAAAVNNWPTGGYISMTTDIDWTGSSLTYNSQAAATEITWPDKIGFNSKSMVSTTRVQHGDISTGLGATPSTFKGNIVVLSFTCSAAASTNVVTLIPYNAFTNENGSELQGTDLFIYATSATITINCVPAPANTPAPTPTATATTSPIPTCPGACRPAINFRVKAGSVDCAPTAKPAKCTVANGGTFSLAAAVNNWPTGGYISMATDIDWTGSSLTYNSQAAATEITWPDKTGLNEKSMVSTTRVQHGDCSMGCGAIPSTFKGNVVVLSFTCSTTASANVVTLIPYDVTNGNGSELQATDTAIYATSATITINCVAPPTRMQKLPALQNLFLTRQGTKIPPARCVDGSNVATLTEAISAPITSADPKNPSQPQQLGGFSFQVKYDPLKVCLRLRPGPAWTANPQQVCTVQDSVTAPTVQGIATIHCVTLGKATVVDTSTASGRTLATIEVRPQPALFNQIKPNQDNGQAVRIDNEGCKLTDLQGHAINVFSCESASVTIRFLEGDVEPDCQVNTLDTQSIAFRWGATKGGLIFNDRFNLMPLPPASDQVIDINDLQFVFGRFGSTCASPWPAQPPVNPKR